MIQLVQVSDSIIMKAFIFLYLIYKKLFPNSIRIRYSNPMAFQKGPPDTSPPSVICPYPTPSLLDGTFSLSCKRHLSAQGQGRSVRTGQRQYLCSCRLGLASPPLFGLWCPAPTLDYLPPPPSLERSSSCFHLKPLNCQSPVNLPHQHTSQISLQIP